MRTIVKLLTAILIIGMTACIMSCSSESDPQLAVSMTENTDFSASGGGKWVDVTSDAEWNVSVQYEEGGENWLALNVIHGSGNYQLRVVAGANNSTEKRVATLVIVCAGNENIIQRLTFTQAGVEPKLIVSPSNFTVFPFNRNLSIKIDSNTDWEITTDAGWLKLDKEKGKGAESIEVSVDDNEGGERKATITVTTTKYGISKSIQVTQMSLDSYLYREPSTAWGTTTAETKAYMAGYELTGEYEKTIVYNGKFKESLTSYSFDDGKLWNATVALMSSDVDSLALVEQMKMNNYKFFGKSTGGIPLYESNDSKTITFLDNVSMPQAYFVHYYDYSQPFKAPCTSWRTTTSNVKSYMTKNGNEIAEEGTASNRKYIAYYGTRLESFIVYYFSSLYLQEADIFLDPNIVPFHKACEYISTGLSYDKSSHLQSDYGNVYESRNGETVALVIRPDYSPTKTLQIGFMSYADAYSAAGGNSRSITRSGKYDIILEHINRQSSEPAHRLLKKSILK